MKKALITGITGQDGSYLAELLLSKGYEVHGIIRRSSSFNTQRVDHILKDPHSPEAQLKLHYGDLLDSSSLMATLNKVKPDEVYNLGAQSHVRVSFDTPEYTADVTGMGTTRILNAILSTGLRPRFYQASSSEMFGKVHEVPQKETTPFYPRSPYGYAKVMGYWATVNAREAYGLHASNGILFNHESPRRTETFVTRKITRALARIVNQRQDALYLGNLDAKRDWGYARDYVEAMWLMLQQAQGDDYVVATGETHSVREFLDLAFEMVGLDWKKFVKIDERYHRPSEVDLLLGDPTKAQTVLKWKPTVTFPELVRLMVTEDLKLEGLDPQRVLTSHQKTTRPKPGRESGPRLVSGAKSETMSPHSRIYVAGHTGLVGGALTTELENQGYKNLVLRTHSELDLLDQAQVRQFFRSQSVDYVFICAARVGGIFANMNQPVEFLYENIQIASNLIHAAAEANVKKLIFLGSSCAYPRKSEQPIHEESLLTGPLEPTNEGYALAKISGIKMAEYFNRQYGRRFFSAMPTNIYGRGDNFHPTESHVAAALLRKFHEAKVAGKAKVTLAGTGSPLREFLNARDLASALILMMRDYEENQLVNIGSGEEIAIKDLAQIIAEIVGFSGRIEFDTTKPDGMPRKYLDSSRIRKLGWKPAISLKAGIKDAYEWACREGVLTNPDKKRNAA